MGGAAQAQETRDALKAASSANDVTFPAPTTEPVDLKQYYKILGYDPENGGGDLRTIFSPKALASHRILREAEAASARLMPNDAQGQRLSGWKDAQDAIRHALGSYVATKEFGAKPTKKITDRHERAEVFSSIYASQLYDNDGSRLQDLYNNHVGRAAALDPANRNRDPEEVIMELYRAGKLQTLPFKLK